VLKYVFGEVEIQHLIEKMKFLCLYVLAGSSKAVLGKVGK